MTTYEDVHTGDVILGHDNTTWGVAALEREPVLMVTLVRHDTRVTGWPPPGTEVTIVAPADVAAERAAAQVLVDAGLAPELVSENWTT